ETYQKARWSNPAGGSDAVCQGGCGHQAAAQAGWRLAEGAPGEVRAVADPARRDSGVQILHLHLPGGERLRPGADREHGSLGEGARGRAPDFRAQAPVLLRAGVAPDSLRGEVMTTVVAFPRRSDRLPVGWRSEELQQIVSACSGSVSIGEASG